MDQLFGSLRAFIQIEQIVNDSFVFRLHYKFTVALLVGASLLVTSRQYFGDPIDCISKDDIPPNLLDTYCWIHSTFSVVDAWNKTVGTDVPYPGVDKYLPGEERVFHTYYQWVCFVLFFQAMCFYAPKYIWMLFESDRLKTCLVGLNNPILNDAPERQKTLINYFSNNLGGHRFYYSAYVFCEFLTFVNILIQIYLIDLFLGGEFSTYGISVIMFTAWDDSVRYDPMIRVFPRMTKCTFHRYGSSGDVQKHDAMCILPINNLNEKIYIGLWFWFYALAVVTLVGLIWRLTTFASRKARYHVFAQRANFCSKENLHTIFDELKAGDWYLLDLLGKNMDPIHFRDFIYMLTDYCQERAFERDTRKRLLYVGKGNNNSSSSGGGSASGGRSNNSKGAGMSRRQQQRILAEQQLRNNQQQQQILHHQQQLQLQQQQPQAPDMDDD